MQKWEYAALGRKSAERLSEGLRRYGIEGWELVSVTFSQGLYVGFLKRPVTA